MPTKIEWTNETWNPIVGCSKISEGCKNCYAEKMAKRLASISLSSEFAPCSFDNYVDVLNISNWNGKTSLREDQLPKPSHWKKPRKIFVCSMGDLFHESVPFEWIDIIIIIIAQHPEHTFQVLTKRPHIALEYFRWKGKQIKDNGLDSIPSQSDDMLDYVGSLKNLWLGATTENQEEADRRIPILLQIPAAIHFISYEPALSAIDVNKYLPVIVGKRKYMRPAQIDWVIAGPETGHHARPFEFKWFLSLYDQCYHSGTAFFDKKNILGRNIHQFPFSN
jgi:protein gp37